MTEEIAKYGYKPDLPSHIITKCGWEKGKLFVTVESINNSSGITKQLVLSGDEIAKIVDAKSNGRRGYQLPLEAL